MRAAITSFLIFLLAPSLGAFSIGTLIMTEVDCTDLHRMIQQSDESELPESFLVSLAKTASVQATIISEGRARLNRDTLIIAVSPNRSVTPSIAVKGKKFIGDGTGGVILTGNFVVTIPLGLLCPFIIPDVPTEEDVQEGVLNLVNRLFEKVD